jgi:hypothetical protein
MTSNSFKLEKILFNLLERVQHISSSIRSYFVGLRVENKEKNVVSFLQKSGRQKQK